MHSLKKKKSTVEAPLHLNEALALVKTNWWKGALATLDTVAGFDGPFLNECECEVDIIPTFVFVKTALLTAGGRRSAVSRPLRVVLLVAVQLVWVIGGHVGEILENVLVRFVSCKNTGEKRHE